VRTQSDATRRLARIPADVIGGRSVEVAFGAVAWCLDEMLPDRKMRRVYGARSPLTRPTLDSLLRLELSLWAKVLDRKWHVRCSGMRRARGRAVVRRPLAGTARLADLIFPIAEQQSAMFYGVCRFLSPLSS
jgi:hypothetical protein